MANRVETGLIIKGLSGDANALYVTGNSFINGDVNITGNVNVIGTATTLNTETVQTRDNKILLNYSGTNLTAIGGGIEILSAKTDGTNVSLTTDISGDWNSNTGLNISGRTSDSSTNALKITNLSGITNFSVRNDGFIDASQGYTVNASNRRGRQLIVSETIIGQWPATSGNNFAFFGNSSINQTLSGNYAMLQDTNGAVFLNSASSTKISVRQNNNEFMSFSNSAGDPDISLGSSSGEKINYFGSTLGNKIGVGLTGTTIQYYIRSGDTISFNTGGELQPIGSNELMRIQGSNGNVGIGISAPTAKLHVNNTTTSNTLLFEDDTNPDATPFVITNVGRVGVGTLTPNANLHVQNLDNDSGTTRVLIESRLTNSSSGNTVTLHARANLDNVSANNIIALFEHTNPAGGTGGGTIMKVTGGISQAGVTRNMTALNINSIGYVSIGSTTSGSKLFNVDFNDTNSINYNGVDFYSSYISNTKTVSGSTASKYGLRIDSTGYYNPPSGYRNYGLFVDVNSGLGSGTSYSAIFNGGNVGIGISTPTERLDVNGKTKTTTLQITSGATAGYVLTAIDSNGNASWQPATGGSSGTTIIQQFTGNTSGDCITDLYVRNLHGCSPIYVHDILSGNSTNNFLDLSSSSNSLLLQTTTFGDPKYLGMGQDYSGIRLQSATNNYLLLASNAAQISVSDSIALNLSGGLNKSVNFERTRGLDILVSSPVGSTSGSLFQIQTNLNAGGNSSGHLTGGTLQGEIVFGKPLDSSLPDNLGLPIGVMGTGLGVEQAPYVFPTPVGEDYFPVFISTPRSRAYDDVNYSSIKNILFGGGSNNTVYTGVTNSALIGGSGNTINSYLKNTVVLGGEAITATTSNTVYVPDLVIKKSASVPTSSGDTVGDIGSVTWDNTYLYVKTNTGWGRTLLDYGF